MNSSPQALVHRLFATYLQVDQASITDAKSFDELGLHALDLVFLALRLEDLDSGLRDFPVDLLNEARTVGDFVALVTLWLPEDESPNGGARRKAPCAARV
jgi:acyl carrier protein